MLAKQEWTVVAIKRLFALKGDPCSACGGQ